ncbi:hypothetical protein HAZT_HAZT005344 [Hyalella azteca]|uniref:Uncharacterized protein n=1 Tax=Hyalella azteca TaxID=294128 RepID=A0A6A0H782_HYAAZ|nr:hypothetical protein HAZT_HAZT005344 [Hyalella azteca]
MSRFFSFIKKKGDKDGGEFPASPPPSPLAKSKSEGEGKSVKQVKKRSNKRERHKRPAGPSAPSEDGSSLETEPVELISTDANGNSMTGKIKSTSNSNAGEMVLKITAEGECDSLGDVDSISEEEIANGKVNRTNISSSAPQEDESVVENENQDGIIIEDGCRINIDVTVNGHGNIHESAVTKVSFSGTNDDSLVDDFMDEAFDDLEVEVEIKEETSVLSTSECNGDENEQSKVLASSSPAEKYSDSPNEPMKVDVDDIPSVVLRPLSTDTAVTHYSSCEPGSDVFDSASDEFHDAPDVLNSSGFPSDTIQLSSDILAEPSVEYADDVGDIHNSEDVSLDLRTNYTPKDLEFCFEVPSKGRTSFLAVEAAPNATVDLSVVAESDISGVADHRAESRAISTPILNGSLISFSCDVSADAGDAPTEPQPNDRKRSSTCASEDSSQRSSRSSFKQQMSLEDELSKYDDKMIKEEVGAASIGDGGSGGRSSSTRATSAAATACTNSVAGHHHTPGTVPPPPPLPQYTRHSSEESNPDDPASSKDLRLVDMKCVINMRLNNEVFMFQELEEKFRGAMISNAQLDNEKTQLTYQVELLKDVRADITEQLTQLKKEHKKKCSEHEQLRKVYAKLQEESRKLRRVLEQRDELIQEYGLVVVGGVAEEDEEDDEADEDLVAREETEDGLVLPRPVPMKRVLLSQEAAEILEKGAAKGSLEWRLRRVVEHKRELEDELRRVNLELEEQVNNQRLNNCLDSNIQKEANKTVNEYKFRVQRAEAEVSSLQANVNRLEVLVTRYKTQVEELEKSEEELKVEKRKLQRERRELQEKSDELESSKNYIKRQYEKLLHDLVLYSFSLLQLREAQGRLEELETTNSHLLRRFEKLKNARSNLLKDLSQDPV